MRHALRYRSEDEDIVRLDQGDITQVEQLLDGSLWEFRQHGVVADLFDRGLVENLAASLFDQTTDVLLDGSTACATSGPQLDLDRY